MKHDAEHTPVDQFDKALALAREFAAQEVASVNRIFDRMLKIFGAIVALAGICATWFGIQTNNALRQQVKDGVANQMPPLVQQQIAAQFDKEQVHKTVEQILTQEVRAQIGSMVDERVGGAVSAEISRQGPAIQSAVNSRTSQLVEQLRPEINAAVDRETTRIVSQHFAARKLTTDQQNALVAALKPIEPKVLLLFTDASDETQTFGQQLEQVFRAAGWFVKYEPHSGNVNLGNYTGILVASGQNPQLLQHVDRIPPQNRIKPLPATGQLLSALRHSDIESHDDPYTDGCVLENHRECFTITVVQRKLQ